MGRHNGNLEHPLYQIWNGMRKRCYTKSSHNYARYGGRGITVAPRWDNFWCFVSDMGPRPSLAHSLDRYPNKDGNYEPGNCRWATAAQQLRNTSRTKFIEHGGERLCVADWAARFGVLPSALWHRIRKYGVAGAMNMGMKTPGQRPRRKSEPRRTSI